MFLCDYDEKWPMHVSCNSVHCVHLTFNTVETPHTSCHHGSECQLL